MGHGSSSWKLAALGALVLPATGMASTLVIEAYVDGRDHLILQAGTAQWLHLDYAAVGRWDNQDLPTYFNDVAWTPSWPGHPAPDEIRVFGVTSALYTGLTPALPNGPMTVSLANLTIGRGPVTIVQYPDAANAYTLKIEFNDNDVGLPATSYAGWYTVQLDVSPVPEPPSYALWLVALGLAGVGARRHHVAMR